MKRVTRPEPIVEFRGELDSAPGTAPSSAETSVARSRRSLVGPLVVVALLLSAVSLGLSVAGRRNDAARRQVVVIERQVEPAPAPVAAVEPPEVAAPEPAPAPEPSATAVPEPVEAQPSGPDKAPERKPVAAAAPDPRLLTRRFGRKQALVEACFHKHGKAAGAAPQLAIHFKVDTQGRVQQAALLPESVAGTALGQCLLGVARGTQFGAQQREVSFRIPISAQLLGDEPG